MKKINIRMPKKLLADWLAALENPKTKRGSKKLIDDQGGMCCLGVLQMVAANGDKKGIERYEVFGDGLKAMAGEALALPSREWLKEHKVQFLDEHGELSVVPVLPLLKVDGTVQTASSANDEKKVLEDGRFTNRYLFSFKDIAAAIRATAKGI